MRYCLFFLVVLVSFSCKQAGDNPTDVSKVSWDEFYETELFQRVQMEALFPDSKSFTDYIPKSSLDAILQAYTAEKDKPEFDLRAFVDANFDAPVEKLSTFTSDTSRTMHDHIETLWPLLTRDADNPDTRASLIPLPNRYVVPGGRFREVYYWDSYFTMEGLMISQKQDLVEDMVRNFAFLIDSVGFIPNGNRAYYGGRSQPPFFACMVDLLAGNDRDLYISLLPALQKEYDFWMNGQDDLTADNPASSRVVRMPDGSVLNRYWDNFATPRPESYKEDVLVARESGQAEDIMYRHLRAGAESGWDFSSRWFKDGQSIETIHTTEIIPVDLNALLYFLELKLAQGYDWSGDPEKAKGFIEKANGRYAAINTFLWNDEAGFFVDYDWKLGEPTSVLSLAGAYPLYFGIATKSQAARVSKRLKDEFLLGGGFVSTLNQTGQQWDYPNGWAPLQWLTINGLYNYGYHELGNEGARRWLSRNDQVYKSTGKMMEKYNVADVSLLAGGGEYALQDGFGWTNGVALAIEKIFEEEKMVEEMRK